MITPIYSMTSFSLGLPNLALDFTAASLDPRVTVSRALNTATCVNSSGVLSVVNASLPRFDFDPSTLACLGLLIEEGRINVILQSNGFNQAAWAKLNGGAGTAPVLTSGQADPWGGSNAWRLQANSGGSGVSDYSIIRQTITTNNSPRSLWVKSNTGSNQNIYVGAVVSTSVVTVTPTWTRVSLKPVSNSPFFDIGTYPVGSSNTTQNVDILICNAQCETDLGGAATTFTTSYIPTTTAAVTRNADVVSMTGANFSSWWGNGDGSAVVRARPQVVSGVRPTIQFDDTTANNIISLRGNTTNPELYIRSGGSDQAQIDAGTIAANTSYRLAGAWGTNNCAASVNSGTPMLDGVATIPGVTQARLGSDGTNYLNGHLEAVEYYSDRILNSTLQVVSSTAGYKSIISPVILDVIIS